METITTGQPTRLSNISMEDNVTAAVPAFMEQVEYYITYKIASYINQYWFPILVPIGLVGNTLSFLVMVKESNRKMTTCIYMAAISINDDLMMCLAFHDWLISAVVLHEWYLWECKIASLLTNFSLQCATFQVLALTTDRYVAIKWPFKAVTNSTPRRAKLIILGILILTFIYNIPHLFVANLIRNECLSYLVGGTITKIYSWVTFLVNGIIPFSMLIYMNYVILQTIRKSRKMFKTNESGRTKESPTDFSIGMTCRQRKRKTAENQLTIMLLLVTVLFTVLLFPTYIRFIYLSFVERDTPVQFARSMLIYQMTYKLYTTNSGINFFLYCISGRKFRDDLKHILCYSKIFFGLKTDSNVSIVSIPMDTNRV